MGRQFRRGGQRVGLPLVGTGTLAFVVVALAAIVAAPAQTAQTVVIHVNDDAAPGGNGTSRAPYDSLTDALAAAGATSAAVVITVAPGNYAIAGSLVVDRPLELRGSSVLIQDADGWPTGDVVAGTETRIFASNSTLPQVILVGKGDSSVLSDVTIRGFVFEGTATGISMLLTRVQDFRVADNVFRPPANFGLQSVASSGSVTGNHFRGVGTGAIFTGGYPASPSNVVATGNRSVENTLGGMLLNGASINIPELGDQLDATIRDNDLSGNTAPPQGFGLRVFILRRDLGAPGDSQSSASIKALVQDNRIDGNRSGIVIDAGFPYRRVGTVCDSRVYSGTADIELAGNSLAGSLQTPALVTFTRQQSALNPALLPQWGYLHAAHFAISDKDGTLEDAWIDHPATDPFVGPCPDDATNEPLENVFVYNGVVLPNGRNF
jgi:Protein of unknown function (DUF1565)